MSSRNFSVLEASADAAADVGFSNSSISFFKMSLVVTLSESSSSVLYSPADSVLVLFGGLLCERGESPVGELESSVGSFHVVIARWASFLINQL